MDLSGAVEYAIIGLFIVLALTVVALPHDALFVFFDAHTSVAGIVGAMLIAAVIWLGFSCSVIYQWIFNSKGGYESERRPCLKDIAVQLRQSLSEQENLSLTEKRLRRLAYYAWTYAQEKDSNALSSAVIDRIAKCWQRVHFLGANIVSVTLGIGILAVDGARGGVNAALWQPAIIVYLGFGVMFLIRWRQEVGYVHRLERFVVAENWPFLETFLRRVLTIPVERM